MWMKPIPDCPLEPEEPLCVANCADCREEIREGDDCFRIGGGLYCERCVDAGRRVAERERPLRIPMRMTAKGE